MKACDCTSTPRQSGRRPAVLQPHWLPAFTLRLVCGLVPTLAWAQEAPDAGGAAAWLNEITVQSTPGERWIDTVPHTVTVTPASKIEQDGARDIKDVFRDELDVTVRAAPARFTAAGAATGRAGNEGINIRGLEGNQVLMVVDGIRVPNSFSYGAFSTGRGDFLDVDGIKSVEVVRGPAATQFGSDSLAGAVVFRTLDPSNLLTSEQVVGGFARSSYASVDQSWSNTLGVARADGPWQALLLGSYRQGNAVGNQGDNDAANAARTTPNPQDYNNGYVLGKAFFRVNATQQLGLTVDTQNRMQHTQVYSARAVPPLTARSTLNLDAQDQIHRDRVSLEHRFGDPHAPWLQHAETRVYWQDATVGQFATDDRYTAADRTRDNHYRTTVVGFSTVLESNPGAFRNQHLTYGLDWSSTEISGVRDGTVPPFGETFPVKPFPDTAYTVSGVFAQSEMVVGALSLTPGLRLDQFDLSPSPDGYAGAAPAALSGEAVTPRLGAVWKLRSWFAPYGQWAQGYRPPTPNQVNNGFTNLYSGYTSIGNANLKAERADSVEIGVRGETHRMRYAVAMFDNRYQNFISQQVVGGAGTRADPSVFQYINLASAHIRGVEVRTEWSIDTHWKSNGGIAYAQGESDVNGVETPLDTIQPLKAVAGVRYDEALWGVRATLIYSASKDSSQIAAGAAQFAPPSYATLDLGFCWKPTRNLVVNTNWNNVFDARYWRWVDVRGLAASSTVLDAYTAPGRNAQVSVRYDF